MSAITNSMQRTCSYLLRYTPFTPAVVRTIDNKLEIDESLITKRAWLISAIALAIFAITGSPFVGVPLGLTVLCWTTQPTWTYNFFTGKTSTKRHIFYEQFETILNNSSTFLENLDLSLLMENHDCLSNKKFEQIYNALLKKTSRSTPNSYWMDFLKDDDFISVCDFLDRLFCLKLFNNDKRILLSLAKKINNRSSKMADYCQSLAIRYIEDLPTRIDGMLLPKLLLSLTDEDEEILFTADPAHITFKNNLFCTYIEKYYPDDGKITFLTKHFKHIIKKYPSQARMIIFRLAYRIPNKNIDYWISEFNKHNSDLDKNIMTQFQQVVAEAQLIAQKYKEKQKKDNYFRLLFLVFQKDAQQKLGNPDFSTLSKEEQDAWRRRAEFADAFTTEEASS